MKVEIRATLLLVCFTSSISGAQGSDRTVAHASSYTMVYHVGFARAAFDNSLNDRSSGATGSFVMPLPPSPQKHRGSFDQMLGQVLGGTFAAIVVGIVSYRLFDTQANHRVKGDDGYSPNANTAYAIGSFLGSTAAVHLIGMGDGSHSPLLNTAIGTAIVTIPMLADRNDPYLPLAGVFLGAPLQAIGGTIGYQIGRRPPVQLTGNW